MRTPCEVTDVSLYERMRYLRMKTRLIAVEGNRICSLMHEAARRCYEWKLEDPFPAIPDYEESRNPETLVCLDGEGDKVHYKEFDDDACKSW